MNTTQTKHTALPYHIAKGWIVAHEDPPNGPYVRIARVETGSDDGEFILRACNSHYELLRVAKEMTMLAEALLERLPDEPRNRDCYKRTIAAANAIALAERGQE